MTDRPVREVESELEVPLSLVSFIDDLYAIPPGFTSVSSESPHSSPVVVMDAAPHLVADLPVAIPGRLSTGDPRFGAPLSPAVREAAEDALVELLDPAPLTQFGPAFRAAVTRASATGEVDRLAFALGAVTGAEGSTNRINHYLVGENRLRIVIRNSAGASIGAEYAEIDLRTGAVTYGESASEADAPMRIALDLLFAEEAAPGDRRAACDRFSEVASRSGNPVLLDMVQRVQIGGLLTDLRQTDDAALAAGFLRQLNDSVSHSAEPHLARALLEDLAARCDCPIADLIRHLEEGGERASGVLTRIQRELGQDGSAFHHFMRDLALRQRISTLPDRPSVEQLREIDQSLEREERAGNTAASAHRPWFRVQALLTDLADPAIADRSMSDLVEQHRLGNPHARHALFAILASGFEETSTAWSTSGFGREPVSRRQIFMPDLSRLDAPNEGRIRAAALSQIMAMPGALSDAEAAALVTATSGLAARGETARGDAGLLSRLTGHLTGLLHRESTGLSGGDLSLAVSQHETLMRALTDGMLSSTAARPVIAHLYSQAMVSPLNRLLPGTLHAGLRTAVGQDFAAQVSELTVAARNGNFNALLVLASLSGGEGDGNTSVSDVSTRASTELTSIAGTSGESRRAVIDAFMHAVPGGASDRRCRLETLARVAALVPSDIPDTVRATLRAGLSESLPATRRSAIAGLVAIVSHLVPADLEAIAANPSPEVTAALPALVPHLGDESLRELARLTGGARIAPGTTETVGQLIERTRMLGALGTFVERADIMALATLADPASPLHRRLALGNLDGRLDDDVARVPELRRETGLALLRTVELNGDAAIQLAAAETLARHDFGIDLRDPNILNRLQAIQRSHPENLPLNLLIGRLSYGTDAPSLAALFLERGTTLPDAVTIELTDQAVARYGVERVRAVLDAASTFNMLPLELRRLVQVDRPVPPGTMLSLEGRMLTAGTLNVLPPEVRRRLTGLVEPIPTHPGIQPGWLAAENFNRLPPQVRLHISGNVNLLPRGEGIDGSSRPPIPARVFNALDENSRHILSGSQDRVDPGIEVWPDLSQVTLPAAAYNLLSVDLRRSLSGSAEALPPGASFSFQGRSVEATVFNQLPPGMRETITGSQALLPPAAVLRDFSMLAIEASFVNDSQLRSSFRRVQPVEIGRVLALLANGTIDDADSPYRFLSGEPRMASSLQSGRTVAQGQLALARQEQRDLEHLQNFLLSNFERASGESVGVLNRALSLFGHSGLEDFERNQARRLVSLGQLHQRLCEAEQRVAELTLNSTLYDAALENLNFAELTSGGRRREADLAGMRAFATLGPDALATLCPDLARSLVADAHVSGWRRLHQEGLASEPVVPRIERGGLDGVRDGLALLRRIRPGVDGEVRRGSDDDRVIVRVGTEAIDRHPLFAELGEQLSVIGEHMQIISIQAHAEGTRYETFIADATTRAAAVSDAIASVRARSADIRALRDELRSSLDSTDAITDVAARAAIATRVGLLTQVLQLCDPDEPRAIDRERRLQITTRLDDLDRRVIPGETGDDRRLALISERLALRRELAAIDGPSPYERLQTTLSTIGRLTPDTFGRWLADEGPSIGVGILTTVVGLGALSWLARGGRLLSLAVNNPLSSAALTTGLFMVGSESARGSSSTIGRYMSGAMVPDEFGNLRPMALGSDVVGQYALSLIEGTLTTYLAAGAGRVLGGALSSLRGSATARSAFLRENSALVSRLASRSAVLESQLTQPGFLAAARHVMHQFCSEVADEGREALLEDGLNIGMRALVSNLENCDAVTGFLSQMLMSAHSTSTTLRPITAPGSRSSIGGTSVVRFEFSCVDPTREAQFFRDATLRGSRIAPLADGRGFSETLPGGRIVEYLRPDAAGLPGVPPLEVPGVELATHVGAGDRVWSPRSPRVAETSPDLSLGVGDSPVTLAGRPDNRYSFVRTGADSDGRLAYPHSYLPPVVSIEQSNRYARQNRFSDRLRPGFQNAGTLTFFDADGHGSHLERPSTVYDPPNDPVLRQVLADAESLFGHLRSDPMALMEALTRFSQSRLTPPGGSAELIEWYTRFNREHAGERVMLGEFLSMNSGVCSQRALLLKALADHFNLSVTLQRGGVPRSIVDGVLPGDADWVSHTSDGTDVQVGNFRLQAHAWTTMEMDGRTYIFDPGVGVYGESAGGPLRRLTHIPYAAVSDTLRPVNRGPYHPALVTSEPALGIPHSRVDVAEATVAAHEQAREIRSALGVEDARGATIGIAPGEAARAVAVLRQVEDPVITIPLHHWEAAQRNGFIEAGVTWDERRVIRGTLGIPPYMDPDEPRVAVRVTNRSLVTTPVMAGPNRSFCGVVQFGATRINLNDLEVVDPAMSR